MPIESSICGHQWGGSGSWPISALPHWKKQLDSAGTVKPLLINERLATLPARPGSRSQGSISNLKFEISHFRSQIAASPP